MSNTEEIVRRLNEKHRELGEALYSGNTDRFKELYEEEGKLLDELHETIWGDVELAVDRPWGGPRKAP